MTKADFFWQTIASENPGVSLRSSFRFDSEFYLATYPDMRKFGDAAKHFKLYGSKEGRYPNAYARISSLDAPIQSILRDILRDPRLSSFLDSGDADAMEMIFELLRIKGFDKKYSRFSADDYEKSHSGYASFGLSALDHYFLHGHREVRALADSQAVAESPAVSIASPLKSIEAGAPQALDEEPDNEVSQLVAPVTDVPEAAPVVEPVAQETPAAEIVAKPQAIDPDRIWKSMLNRHAPESKRSSYKFDQAFYYKTYPDLHAVKDLERHFNDHGVREGRHGNSYSYVRSRDPEVDDRIAAIVKDERLKEFLREGHPQSREVVFELMRTPGLDELLSRFSARRYLAMYPDIEFAGINPLDHFILHGMKEGRVGVFDAKLTARKGAVAFDKSKPNCFIFQHELSRTGSPIVGRELAEQARRTHNVFFVAMRSGEIEKDVLKNCCHLFITPIPDNSLDEIQLIVPQLAGQKFDFAVINSVEAGTFGPWLTSQSIPFAIYIHEFAEYMLPVLQRYRLIALADRVVFSSDLVRDSWKGVLGDLNIDVAESTAIFPQRQLSFIPQTPRGIRAARKKLSEVIGHELGDKKIIYGAGHAHWRKGTDLFFMVAQMVAKHDPNTAFIWIGDGFNHEDYNFGIWMDLQLSNAGYGKPGGNIHVLPAGPLYATLKDAADIFFLSSRRDPLPNVVFDAAESDCHVVRFKDATGFDDESFSALKGMTAVAFADVEAVTSHILAASKKLDRKNSATEQSGDFVAPFEGISKAMRNVRKTIRRPKADDVVDAPDLAVVGRFNVGGARAIERNKLWQLDRRLVWQSPEAANEAVQEHLHPGLVEVRRVSVNDERSFTSKLPDYHVFVEFGATQTQPDYTLHFLTLLKHAKSITLSVANPKHAESTKARLVSERIRAKVNVQLREHHALLGFLKTTADAPPNSIWVNVNISDSGSNHPMSQFATDRVIRLQEHALDIFATGNVGVVAPYIPISFGWAGSHRVLEQVRDLPGGLPVHPLLDTCNAVWARARVGAAMLKVFGDHYTWPKATNVQSGTPYHLVDKLWPSVAASLDAKTVFAHNEEIGWLKS